MRSTAQALRLLACALLSSAAGWPSADARAESHAACTGFIDSVPAVVTSPGVWCLQHDLATAQASGAAITLAADDVTLECNGFKIGGLAAGTATDALGVVATQRTQVTIRDCGIRGFRSGIQLINVEQVLVERNRLDNSREEGMRILAVGGIVRRNRVSATGGRPDSEESTGFDLYGVDVVEDNVVSGITVASTRSQRARGFRLHGQGMTVRGNRVRGLVIDRSLSPGLITASGISVSGPSARVIDNQVVSDIFYGVGIQGSSNGVTRCIGNTVGRFRSNTYLACADGGGNVAFGNQF